MNFAFIIIVLVLAVVVWGLLMGVFKYFDFVLNIWKKILNGDDWYED